MRCSLITFLFLWMTNLSAQNLEFSGQFYSESYGQRIIPMSNGNWFFAGKIFPGLWEEEEFTVIYGGLSDNGDLFPFTPVPEHDNSNALSIFQKSNGNILLAVEDFSCGQYEPGVVYEINSVGDIITEYFLPNSCASFMDIKSYQNNVFVSCENSIYQIFDDGTMWEVLTDLGEIRSFIPLYNGITLVGCHENNDFQGIKKTNGQNTVLKTLNLTNHGEILKLEGLTFDKNIVLQKNHLHIFNDELAIQNSISIQNIGIEFQRMTFDNNSIWVLANDAENNIYLYGFDYELNVTNDFIVENNGLIANDIAIQNEQVAIVGTGNSGVYQDTLSGIPGSFTAGKNFWIKTFDKNSVIEFENTDVSLDLVTINSADIDEMTVDCNGGNLEVSGWAGDFQEIALTITNQGETMLDYVEANLQIYGCPATDCDVEEETLMNQQYPNLNLAPGASIVVPFPDFEAAFSDADLPQLCLWLSVPNQEIDQNPMDNVFCKYFFDTTIDATDNIEENSNIGVFPNPVSDYLNIEVGNIKNDFKLLIYNNLGQVVFNKKYNNFSSTIEINTMNFPRGAYFLKVESLKGTEVSSTKFIKT